MKITTFAQDAVRTYRNTIYQIALSQTKHPATAEDITQETFMALFEIGPHRFLTKKNPARIMVQNHETPSGQNIIDEHYLKAWLIRTCINTCKDHFRHSRFQILHANFERSFEDNSDQTQRAIDELKDVLEFIDTLPSDQRLVIHLVCIEGYSSKEAAEIMEKPEGTIRSLLHHARKKLKQHDTNPAEISQEGDFS